MTEPSQNAATVAQVLTAAGARLDGEARADAEILLAAALGRSRSWLYAHADADLDQAQREAFEHLLARRRRGEPVAQILGVREFWSLSWTVTQDTLIPRPETELLVELVLQRLPHDSTERVLDLGTGSGAIALALAHERTLAQITAIDSDARTLAVARKNAARLHLERVNFLLGNWFSPVRGERYRLIVSNPPYIAEDDPHLALGDLRFEPRAALVSGVDGLDAIRTIASQAPEHLHKGGHLLLEHGFEQGAAVRELLLAAGFVGVASHRDLEGRERVSAGALPE
jgi:release factor glutamine methyltransferase